MPGITIAADHPHPDAGPPPRPVWTPELQARLSAFVRDLGTAGFELIFAAKMRSYETGENGVAHASASRHWTSEVALAEHMLLRALAAAAAAGQVEAAALEALRSVAQQAFTALQRRHR